jgi:tRNA threonylcarbamoyladenosine modification (KEOPS) complex  Pcc1 subunit
MSTSKEMGSEDIANAVDKAMSTSKEMGSEDIANAVDKAIEESSISDLKFGF